MNCPNCDSPSIDFDIHGHWTCRECNASGILEKETCPQCGFILEGNGGFCPQCGAHVSIVETVLARPADNLASSWLREVRQKAGELKNSEELASEKRMGTLRQQDETRLRAEREALQEARNKERKFLAIAVLSGLFLFIAVILAVLAYLQ
ncbi:MAG: hypothetical protein JXA25_19495 [Anaerolineales bacterium]|nr:hypothetical protein [Anaerolineales bacterium]